MGDLVIAIDGCTSTGKGTTAKGVAKILGLSYLDTGAMYRVAVLQAKRLGLMDASDDQKVAMIKQLDITWQYNPDTGRQETYLNGENVEDIIRQTDHMNGMEAIVKCMPVREEMGKLQRVYGETGGIVADGRDMGTTVYPDADLKIFLECDLDVRVERRVKQLQELGLVADPVAIRTETQQRDYIDYLGPDAVGKKAEDAIVVDTSRTTIDEQIAQIISLAQQISVD